MGYPELICTPDEKTLLTSKRNIEVKYNFSVMTILFLWINCTNESSYLRYWIVGNGLSVLILS